MFVYLCAYMPIECLISFDNNTQGVYYAGQELSGIVDLTVDTTKRIKGKKTKKQTNKQSNIHTSIQ